MASPLGNMTTLDRQTMPSNLTKPQLFTAQQYFPSDMYTASSSVPGLSESAMETALTKIQEQVNACQVAQANEGLKTALLKVEGASLRTSYQAGKNALSRVGYQMDLTFQADKLNIKQNTNKDLLEIEQQRADLKLQTQRDRLAHEQRKAAIPGEFYPKIEQLERRKWEIKLADLERAIGAARQLSDATSANLQTLEAELAA